MVVFPRICRITKYILRLNEQKQNPRLQHPIPLMLNKTPHKLKTPQQLHSLPLPKNLSILNKLCIKMFIIN